MFELLTKAGIPAEQAQTVVDEFPELIKDRYVPVARINELSEEIKSLKGQITDRDKQLKQLKDSAGDNEALKAQIEKLQEDNKTTKADYEGKMQELKFNSALDNALLKAHALDADLVKVKLNKDEIKLKEDGTLEGFEKQLGAVKKDYGYLFDNPVKIDGAKPGEGTRETKAVTKEQFDRMGYTERLNLFNTDKELFNQLSGGNE